MVLPRRGPLPLHPMTLTDILDGAFKLLRANAKTVVTVTAVFVVPIQLVAAFLQRDVLSGRGFTQYLDNASNGDSSAVGDAATFFALLATILVLPFVAGAVSRIVAASYVGEEVDARGALRAAGRRWWSLVVGWLLVHVFEVAPWLLAVVLALLVFATAGAGWAPAVVLVVLGLAGIPWALGAMALSVAVAPAIVVEDLGAWRGLRRSIHLLRPRMWGVLGIALAGGFLANILGQVLGIVPQAVGLAIGGDRGGWVLLAAGGILTSLVATPLVAIISTLVYFDGRIRTEGFDLEMMAADMARAGG